MRNKQKCLIILPRNIFPLVSGYSNTKKNTVEILHRYYQLSIVIISTTKISDEEKEFLKDNSYYFRYITVPRWECLLNALAAIFSKLPIQVAYYYFKRVQRIIDEILPSEDIVIGSLIRSMKYLTKTPPACRIIFDMVDSIGLNYKRSAEKASSCLWRLVYKIETKRLLQYEEYWIRRSHATMLFNKQESDYWSAHGNIFLVPHGVKNELFSYNKVDSSYSRCAAFIGKMNYQPNIDAAMWYVENVHSKIGNVIPFIIAGAYPTPEIIALAEKKQNITVTGFTEDPYLILNSAMAIVAPMQTGAGIQNKVLETMALGTVNILTSLAAAPIVGATDGEHFLIADNADDFSHILLDIAEHPAKYDNIKQSARDFIARNYTWQMYEREYIRAIESACSGKDIR